MKRHDGGAGKGSVLYANIICGSTKIDIAALKKSAVNPAASALSRLYARRERGVAARMAPKREMLASRWAISTERR